MKIKGITDEDFVNYKVPSMYIATATCSFKCDKECGRPVCQNSDLAKQPSIEIGIPELIKRYLDNPITHAVVFGGLEPFDQFMDVFEFTSQLRYCIRDSRNTSWGGCYDPVVIYTGYTSDEIKDKFGIYKNSKVTELRSFQNIIIKFGRYIPNQQPHYDPVLGVYLASDNQYAERIS